jgi:hypothetical protein
MIELKQPKHDERSEAIMCWTLIEGIDVILRKPMEVGRNYCNLHVFPYDSWHLDS